MMLSTGKHDLLNVPEKDALPIHRLLLNLFDSREVLLKTLLFTLTFGVILILLRVAIGIPPTKLEGKDWQSFLYKEDSYFV